MSRVRLFGKLPAHGDFVVRGLVGDDRAALDGWLSASLAEARAVHAEAFEQRFDTAPPWRHVADDLTGALAASQDAAGRRFPVFLALAGAADEGAAEACEALLYRAIGEGWTADTLVGEADIVPVGDAAGGPARWWTLGGDGFPPAELLSARPADLITAMLTVTA